MVLEHQREWGIRGMLSLRIKVAATRYRVPDVTVLDRSRPKEQIITHPPLAVFEVLSPEDRVQRLKRKLEDYRAMGIPEIWSSIPRTVPFIAMKTFTSAAPTPSLTLKKDLPST